MTKIEGKKFFRNGIIAFGAFIGWYFLSLILGEVISELLGYDISNQIYQIFFLTGFGIATLLFIIKARRFKSFIGDLEKTNPEISKGMSIIHKIQMFFGFLIILFVIYTIFMEGTEIIKILSEN
jgi:MFS family permease